MSMRRLMKDKIDLWGGRNVFEKAYEGQDRFVRRTKCP